MATVNLEDWRFLIGGSPAALRGMPGFEEPLSLVFSTHVDLLRHVAEHNEHDAAIQNKVDERLKADPVASSWHQRRTTFKLIPHFQKYRESEMHDQFHAAALHMFAGNATAKQQAMVQGLDLEIKASRVTVPAGQVLFHGRGDEELHASTNYPSFISTSLDPMVSVFHATKRKLEGGDEGKAFIYAITLTDDLPAIWGNGGKFSEWELLLGTRLRCISTARHTGGRFELIEATIGL